MNKRLLSIFLTLSLAFLSGLLFENVYSHGFPESPDIKYHNDLFFLKTAHDKIPIMIQSNVNHVTTFIFDSNDNSLSFKIPFESRSNSNDGIIASIRIPESFATYTTDKWFYGYVDGVAVSEKAFITDPYSHEDSNLVYFILDKNELERINLLSHNNSEIMEFKIMLPIVKEELPYYKTGKEHTIPTISCNEKLVHVKYEIENGKMISCAPHGTEKSLVLKFETKSDGQLTIKIPKNVDGWEDVCNDANFLVLVDGEETNFDEKKSFFSRTLTISFEEGSTQIEILTPFLIDDKSSKVYGCIAKHSPKQQLLSNIQPQNVICSRNFILIEKFSDHSVVCVIPSTAASLVERGWGQYQYNHDSFKIEMGSNVETINYSIRNGVVNDIHLDTATKSMAIEMSTTGDGQLIIVLPRTLIDAKLGPDGHSSDDDSFFVLVDRFEVAFDEAADSIQRTLTINFPAGTKTIEIIGSFPLNGES